MEDRLERTAAKPETELEEFTARLIATWQASLNRVLFVVLAWTALLMTVFVVVVKAH